MGKYNKERDADNKAMKPWSRRINKLLNERNMTQNELAAKSGVPSATISGWINNEGKAKTVEPKVEGFLRVAKALGVSVDYLLGKNECKSRSNEQIYKLTGLSDNALKALKALNKNSTEVTDENGINEKVRKLFVLNYLIENIVNSDLLDDLYDYWFEDFFFRLVNGNDAKTMIIHSKAPNGKENKSIVFSEIAGHASFVLVQRDLMQIKSELTEKKDKTENETYKKWEEEYHEELTKESFTIAEELEAEAENK